MVGQRDPEERRTQVIRAALDVIRERGVVNMRVQDVATKADLSTGIIHYYFRDVQTLVLDIYRWTCDRFYSDRLASIERTGDAREQLARMIDAGLPDGPDDAVALAMYEIDLVRRGSPAHALLMQALYDRQVGLYFSILQLGVAQGHFTLRGSPLDLAQDLVALEDGYGLHVVHGNTSLSHDRCRDLLLAHARTITSCALIGAPAGKDRIG